MRHRGDRDVGDVLHVPRHLRRVAREDERMVVVRRRDRGALHVGVAHAGVRPLRVPPRELPVVHLRPQRDRPADVVGDPHAVVHRVGRAGRDQADVGDRPRRPGVALVDHVAALVELQAAIEMRAGFHRALAAVLDRAAVKDGAALVVERFELDPDVERVDGAAGEEVADLACPDDDLETDRVAGAHHGVDLAQRSDDFRRPGDERLLRAEVHRLLADGERAREILIGGDDLLLAWRRPHLRAPGRRCPRTPHRPAGTAASSSAAPRRR